jgi:multidrug efflux pump subunit AcrA (membrane-fusion protein)
VSQHNIPYIHPGQKVQFVSQLFQGIRMGKVLKIAKSSFNSQLNQPEPVGIEPEFAVLASIVTAKSDNLLLGAQIDARFVVKEKSMTICIPAEAFLYKNDSSLVFVANNGSARRRTIQIGLANDCFLEVTSGLTAADTVITFGNLDVFEGCTITTDENKYSNDQAKPKNKLNLPEF